MNFTFPSFVIHRSKDTEREELVCALENSVSNVQRFEAIEGYQLVNMPSRHPDCLSITSEGNQGNTMSHILILKRMIASGSDEVCIFEDDAVIEQPFQTYYESKQDWDILYLGVMKVIDGDKIDDYWKVRSSYGTHAVILKRKAMRAIVETFMQTLKEGYFYPADWLYNRAIKDCGLVAYAPAQALVQQKKGLVSLVSGTIRT